MSAHAVLSPSSSKRWGSSTGCSASARRAAGLPNPSNQASRKGTAKHMVSAVCLEKNVDAVDFLGRLVVFVSEIDAPEKERECFAEDVNLDTVIVRAEFPIDDEFVSHCEIYINYVRNYVALTGGELFVEQRLSIEHITKEVDAKGTTDALVVSSKTLTVIDAKFGVSKVNAFERVKGSELVEPNSQLAMYADAALVEHAMFFDFEFVTMVIVQPALNHVSEHTVTVDQLKAYIETLRVAADLTRSPDATFNPTSDNCFFCTARSVCEARQANVLEIVLGDFDDLTTAEPKVVQDIELGDIFNKLSMIRKWCDDIDERVVGALDNGQLVKRSDGLRYKLVTGKMGNREWSDEQVATDLMRNMRLKDAQMFNMKLISPTQAEKLTTVPKGEATKPVIGTVRWNKLKALIERKPGKPTAVIETDPRDELHPAESLFDVLPEPTVVAASTEILSDLFS